MIINAMENQAVDVLREEEFSSFGRHLTRFPRLATGGE